MSVLFGHVNLTRGCVRAILLMGSLAAMGLFLAASPRSKEETIAWIRAQFVEAMRVGGIWEATPEKDRKDTPTWYTALRPAMRQPADLILEAIDRSLQGNHKDERAGALSAYAELVSDGKVPRSPTRFQQLLKLYAEDDGLSPAYTGTLVNALATYPSRETLQVLMDRAAHAKTAKDREGYLFVAANLLAIDLPLFTATKPLDRAQILAGFQAWYEKNKNSIRFDSKGDPSTRGAHPSEPPRNLTAEERAAVRKDPACVLELVEGSSAGIRISEARLHELMDRCGEALFGPEGIRLMKEVADTAGKSGSPSFDQQISMAAARGEYPSLDAARLAFAYVAADDSDPQHRDLAKKALDDIGSPDDMARVLKGESGEVRRKALALAGE